jgi:hypothetical protein
MCPVYEEFKKSTCPAGVYKKKNVCAQFMRNLKNLLALRAYTRKKNVCAQFMRNLTNLLALRAYYCFIT